MIVTPNPRTMFSNAASTTPANTLARKINAQSKEVKDGAVKSLARIIPLIRPLQQVDPRASLRLSCVRPPSTLGHCLA
jgi:hypothetical protein